MSTQLCLLNSLQFSTEEDSDNPLKLSVPNPEYLIQQHELAKLASWKRTKPAEGDAVLQLMSS
jgi:hypothetical protein